MCLTAVQHAATQQSIKSGSMSWSVVEYAHIRDLSWAEPFSHTKQGSEWVPTPSPPAMLSCTMSELPCACCFVILGAGVAIVACALLPLIAFTVGPRVRWGRLRAVCGDFCVSARCCAFVVVFFCFMCVGHRCSCCGWRGDSFFRICCCRLRRVGDVVREWGTALHDAESCVRPARHISCRSQRQLPARMAVLTCRRYVASREEGGREPAS
ncbi:trans-sialidase [Trypanosoma cruzi]|nr:trans-sialidase [Trypanosoma cruzi]